MAVSDHVDLETFMKGVERRNTGQSEFIQAVREVAQDIFEFIADGAMLSHTGAVVQATGRGAAMHPSSHLAAGATPSSTSRPDERSSSEPHCRPGTRGSCARISYPPKGRATPSSPT